VVIYQILLSLTALFFGSLTGVLVKRIPLKKDFGLSRSECGDCGYQLKWYENIPLISFIILLGRCSNCNKKISYFYPGIEIGFLICSIPFINIAVKRFVAFANVFDQVFIFLDFLFYLSFIAIALALGLIDQKKMQLPHVLTYSGVILGIVYVSLFGSPYYSASESLVNLFSFMPGFLLSTFSAIKQFAIVVFSLDLFVYFANLLIFRENALLEASNALSFGQKKLQENTKLVYLLYSVLVLSLVYFGQSFILEIFFIIIGFLYLGFEIIPFFSVITSPQGAAISPLATPSHHEELDDEVISTKKTILGGGDIMMLGFFATILGFIKGSLVFVTSFYVAFIFLMLKIIYRYFKFQISLWKESDLQQDKTFDIKDMIRGNIPLGLALAISFITVMMMLAK
jgi:prepilin signal peptidase PulO-like enzyme (type II secretory pathway)